MNQLVNQLGPVNRYSDGNGLSNSHSRIGDSIENGQIDVAASLEMLLHGRTQSRSGHLVHLPNLIWG